MALVFRMLRNENSKVHYCTINGAVFISDMNNNPGYKNQELPYKHYDVQRKVNFAEITHFLKKR